MTYVTSEFRAVKVDGIVPDKKFTLKSSWVNNESSERDDGMVPHSPQFCRLAEARFRRAVIAVHWVERNVFDASDRNLL